ncbi:hypothetical protein OGATHE_006137 [Ogataea polymorpha]|uniref:Uncharacterized protein n=1 Tax=Ogataea polymorpha TaxID=460523 RepID=A0A9P8SXT8_9ASCO|nr:hypothetical protein OGATHE_006137 [Ogataea polymorpha]
MAVMNSFGRAISSHITLANSSGSLSGLARSQSNLSTSWLLPMVISTEMGSQAQPVAAEPVRLEGALAQIAHLEDIPCSGKDAVPEKSQASQRAFQKRRAGPLQSSVYEPYVFGPACRGFSGPSVVLAQALGSGAASGPEPGQISAVSAAGSVFVAAAG